MRGDLHVSDPGVVTTDVLEISARGTKAQDECQYRVISFAAHLWPYWKKFSERPWKRTSKGAALLFAQRATFPPT